MSVIPLRTDLSWPRNPRASRCASMAIWIPSMGTSKSAALVAVPLVTQPARAARSTSGGNGAPSTPPRSSGSSSMMVNRRGGAAMLFPPAYHSPTVTWVLVPRCQVDVALITTLPSAGFSRISWSVPLRASRLTSLRPSDMTRPPMSEQAGDHPRRALGPAGLHLAVVHGLAKVIEDGITQLLDRRAVVVHPHAGPQAIQPARDVEVLLEVVAKRKVEEGRLEGGQLHGRGEAALHDGEMRGGVVAEEVGDEGLHDQLRAAGELARRQAGPRDEDHPRVGQPGGHEGKGLGALDEQV